jgi:integrase
MASIRKVGDYQWQVQIRRKNFPQISATFAYKADAEAWGREQETAMKNGTWVNTRTLVPNLIQTLDDALKKYAETESSKKKGEKRELGRINKWRDNSIAKLPLDQVNGQHLAVHRDQRRKDGKAENTIRLELALLSRVYEVARKEWGLKDLRNPIKDITMPSGSRERDRRLAVDEEKKLLDELDKGCRNKDIPRVVRFALASGMRQSEIIGKPATSTLGATTGLTWENIDKQTSTAFLPDTKSPRGKEKNRTIPLFDDALAILNSLKRPEGEQGQVFTVRQDGLIRAFADACKRAKIYDLHFHDLRHEFTSRLIEYGWHSHDVMAVTGHSTSECLRRYVNIRAADLAEKMRIQKLKNEQ